MKYVCIYKHNFKSYRVVFFAAPTPGERMERYNIELSVANGIVRGSVW